jgi:hypothetical protein
MKTGNRAIIKLLIVFISFCCIDGERSILLFSNNIQILLTRDHVTDIEVPYQEHHINIIDDEKWIETFKFDFSSISLNSAKFLFALNYSSPDYPDSIWQPPRFV